MPRPMTAQPTASSRPCRLSRPAIVCPLGDDPDSITEALFKGRRGLVKDTDSLPGKPLFVGRVDTPLPSDVDWPAAHRSRNNRLLAAALERLAPTLEAFYQRCPHPRIAVILGTSTSGIAETERATRAYQRDGHWPEDFAYGRHEIGSPARFVADQLGLDGPAYTLSTACTSSAKALTSAKRMLATGAYDAVICGGADSLCGLTLNGFASLSAISDTPCQPFSINRNGINLGEAAVLFLATVESGGIQLSGYGESSDAHHISAPCPQGKGAEAAMRAALSMAGQPADAIDYLNLHGTATRQNDSMEALAVSRLFGSDLPCSSTKALTGHTLGACGALEAAFCWLALESGRLPPHVNDGEFDPLLAPLAFVSRDASPPNRLSRVMSNAFAFGGNNTALLLEHAS